MTSNSHKIVETARLVLSPARLADIKQLYAFLGDPVAMQFTHVDATFPACRKRVLVHEWFRRRDGFAPWVIREKTDQAIVGWGGLYIDPFDTGWGPEVGYYFHPDVWGHGFATELMDASLRLAQHEYGLSKLTAFAHPENLASQGLLEKFGFERTDFIAKLNRYRFKRVFSSVTSPPDWTAQGRAAK